MASSPALLTSVACKSERATSLTSHCLQAKFQNLLSQLPSRFSFNHSELDKNKLKILPNGTFTGLARLTELYVTRLSVFHPMS